MRTFLLNILFINCLSTSCLISIYYLWEIKKQYASGITNTRIDRVSKKAFDSGAISLKVTGAGGGGHLFVYAEPKKHKNLESNLKKLGVTRVHFSYHNAGATVFNINNL